MPERAATVLVCDDEPAIRFAIDQALESLGVRTVLVSRATEALERLSEADVLITDLAMPEIDGMELLARARAADAELPVLMLTAKGSERTAVEALKKGAWDYLAKPFAVDELRASVRRALEVRTLRDRSATLSLERAVGKPLIGDSPAFARLLSDARKVGRRDVTVLVRGETGTGKELIASAIHAASPRHAQPCIRFNCAALAESLAEAELFGHHKGAFTGASASRAGYFRQAHRGTLVLDEVGELPLSVQAKLLRALQEGEIQPVGAPSVEKVDVRVVACTHRDLRGEVAAGRFREDLFYRLAVVELTVPSLRERPGDVPLLVEAFRRRYVEKFELGEVTFAPELTAALAAQSWPGNVRELENAVARLLALAEPGERIEVSALTVVPAAGETKAVGGTLREQMATFERGVVENALHACGGNQSETARRLGVSRMTLLEKLKRFGLKT